MTHLPHGRKLLFFAALNAADLALTWWIVERGGGRAYESNPVASWCLTAFGWPGLAGFKVAVVALVTALAVTVSRQHPRAGGHVLAFGCCAVLAVVVYSSFLVGGRMAVGEHAAEEIGQAEETSRGLDRDTAQLQAYNALLGCLRKDLIARRSTLDEATETLAGADYVQNPGWRRAVALRLPGRSVREFLAVRLMEAVLNSPGADPDGSGELARELDAQYRSCFGQPPPPLRVRY